MSNVVKARIAYVGAALENGEMEVRDLVPALLAFSDLVEHANRALGGEQRIKVMLNQDSIKFGSFDVTFLLDTTIIEQAKLFLGVSSSQMSLDTLVNALGWEELNKASAIVTVFGTGGVFGLLKWLGGKAIKKIKEGKKRSELTLDDGTKGTVDNNVLKIFLDVKCRISIEKIIEPVKREGIEAFELRRPESKEDDTPIERVNKDDASFFDAPASGIAINDLKPSQEREDIFKIVSVNFENGKWKFNDGNGTFWAAVEDKEFNLKMKRREINFACGDMLRVVYFTQQKFRNDNLVKETVVTRVIEVIVQPQQIKLDFEQDE